jgi:LysM repeat protein
LGGHTKKSRLSRSAKAAAPALAGVAAAVCLSPQAFADTSAPQVTTHQAAALDAVSQPAVQPAQVMADLVRAKQRNPVAQHTPAALPTQYTVRSGDSLSSIAKHFYQNPDAWPVLYWANHSKVRWANIIAAGQVLRVPAKPARIPSAPAELGPPAPKPVAAPVRQVVSAPVRHSYTTAQAPAVTTSTYSGSAAGGSFQACVIARESGGNSQVMNASGHYGLYQFSASTWAAYGGSPGDFGHASVGEQNQVFSNAMARGGQSNWSPYDGC